MTIMVIEDEELLLNAITKKLEVSGIKPLAFLDADSALSYLTEESNVPPHAIWLDYHLKGTDGLEFTKRVKESPKLKSIPIVVVSNSANDETVKNVLSLGVDKYLLKAEHRLDDIIKVIESILETNK